MAWIRTISGEKAAGSLKQQPEVAVQGADQIFNIVKISSLQLEIPRTFIQLYIQLMHDKIFILSLKCVRFAEYICIAGLNKGS